MASGSLNAVKINGVNFFPFGDANVALTARVEKEALAHAGGNLIKETLVPGSATAVKIKATVSEYKVLLGLIEDNAIPLSYEFRDGSVARTTGAVKLGDYMSEDSSVECEFLTTTGVWDLSAAS